MFTWVIWGSWYNANADVIWDGPETLHFQPGPKQCWCYWSMDHSLNSRLSHSTFYFDLVICRHGFSTEHVGSTPWLSYPTARPHSLVTPLALTSYTPAPNFTVFTIRAPTMQATKKWLLLLQIALWLLSSNCRNRVLWRQKGSQIAIQNWQTFIFFFLRSNVSNPIYAI